MGRKKNGKYIKCKVCKTSIYRSLSQLKDKRFHCSKECYGKIVSKRQKGKNNPIWKELPIDEIKDMYLKEKMSAGDIGKEFNVKHTTIMKRLKENSIKIRPFNKQVQIGVLKNIDKIRIASTGKRNPMYKHGKDVGKKPNRKIYLSVAKEHKKWECYICKKNNTKMDLVVHHLDKNNKNNNPKNIIILCQSCHARIHFKKGELQRVKNEFS